MGYSSYSSKFRAVHIPYHRSLIGEEEKAEIISAIESGWLTSGPRVAQFEQAFGDHIGTLHAVGLSSCTAALNLALNYLDLKEGEEVITTPYSFVASSHAILRQGGKVVFVDIDPATLNIDTNEVASKVNSKTRAILPVHLGGNPVALDQLIELCNDGRIKLIEDCAHAVGGTFKGKPLGSFGFASAFSFYPTKNISSAEGGMLTCHDEEFARWVHRMRKHGMNTDTWDRQDPNEYVHYDITEMGEKCNMTDVQAAIAIRQLEKLESMQARRGEIVAKYDAAFSKLDGVELIQSNSKGEHAHHLYIIRIGLEQFACDRDEIIRRIQSRGVMCSVNYSPIHLFSWYRKNFGYSAGDFPHAEAAGATTISLPIYPALSDEEVDHVIQSVSEAVSESRR